MDNSVDRIISLDQTDDFQVVEGEPDIRGWGVFGADGRHIGEVDDLLVDTGAMKVRYLDVGCDSDLFGGDVGHHVLIPIGYARLDEIDDRVQVDALDSARVRSLPEYRDGQLTEDLASELDVFFSDGQAIGAAGMTEEVTAPILGTRTGNPGRTDGSPHLGDMSITEDRFAADSSGDVMDTEDRITRSVDKGRGGMDEYSLTEDEFGLSDRSLDDRFEEGSKLDEDEKIRRRVTEGEQW